MGEGRCAGFGRTTFVAILLAITSLVVVQSVVHLVVVLSLNRIATVVDLDRSNGLPDVVSTIALTLGAIGGGVVAHKEQGAQQAQAAALALVLSLVTLADLLHDGPHPSLPTGPYVIGVVMAAGLLVLGLALASGARAQCTFAVGVLALVLSFFVSGLDKADGWFARERGDPIAEYQIVAKEGLELLGWSLVALALWDEALRRGRRRERDYRPTFSSIGSSSATQLGKTDETAY
jgi:hypothetical protein